MDPRNNRLYKSEGTEQYGIMDNENEEWTRKIKLQSYKDT
jgi:hypothetical protein